MENNAHINDLRAYADWLEQHPEVQASDWACIDIFGESPEQALALLNGGAKFDPLLPSDGIVYLTQEFGSLTIKHVLHKDKLMQPAIEDGKVIWAMKPEFAFAEVR